MLINTALRDEERQGGALREEEAVQKEVQEEDGRWSDYFWSW